MNPIRIAPSVCVLCSVVVLAWAISASAGDVASLQTFTPGDVADANEVNANFEALRSAVNDNDARLSTVETDPVTRSLIVPAGAINYDGSIVTPHHYGLLWKPENYQVSGTIIIRRPADYAGGNIKMTITFQTDFGELAQGVVDFRASVSDMVPGAAFAGGLTINAPGTAVAPTDTFGNMYTQTFTIPADRIEDEIWRIALLRLGTDSTYNHDIIVNCVDLEYRARNQDP